MNNLTPEQEYEIAIQVICPICDAGIGDKCKSRIFPQYPHVWRFLEAVKPIVSIKIIAPCALDLGDL